MRTTSSSWACTDSAHRAGRAFERAGRPGKYSPGEVLRVDYGRSCRACDIRVQTKRTAQKLAYELVDHTGSQAVPVLNQAAINELSLALLFAQAEAQAGEDGLQYIVLDDPIQSLDTEHQVGLARATEALPPHWGVMLGVIDSPLVDRLKEYVSVPRQIIMLGQYSSETGSQISSQESL